MTKANHARGNGLKALARVKEVLSKIGWDPEDTEIEGLLRVDFESDSIAIADAHADVRVDFERFLFYLNFRDKAPVRHRKQTMEFVTRANFDLVIGNFELDMEEGTLRFKASIDFTGTELSEKLIRNTIRSSMDVVEQYSAAAVEVMQGKKGAVDAIREAETSA